MMTRLAPALLALVAVAGLACAPAAPSGNGTTITIYSGRTEALVGPLLDEFAKTSGISIRVRYGDTAQMAATILEEGDNSPADVFFAQDAGALGALSQAGRLATLPDSLLNKVDSRFRSPKGEWVGVSGRARVFAYNTRELSEGALPASVWELTDPKWKGKVGWAPTNGSFQAFVTAMRVVEGDAKAREWLQAMKRNEPKVYPNNISIVDAVGRGEVALGLVNHYYLYNFLRERGQEFPVRNYHPRAGGVDAMINVAGVGVLTSSKAPDAARRFAEFLLSRAAQQYFTEQTFEYPLVDGVAPPQGAPALSSIKAPHVDLSNLADLQGTLRLLQEVGVL